MGMDESKTQSNRRPDEPSSQSSWCRQMAENRLDPIAVIILTWLAVFIGLLLMHGAAVIAGVFAIAPLLISLRWLLRRSEKRRFFLIALVAVGLHVLICLFLVVLGVIDVLHLRGWL